MKTQIKLTTLIIFLISLSFIDGQDNNSIKAKLKNIDGKVEKIVISTEGNDIVFEGKEAEQLFKLIRKQDKKKMKWITMGDNDFDFDDDNVFIFKSDSGKHKIIKKVITLDDDIVLADGDSLVDIKVEVINDDDNNKVIIEKIIDGNKTVEELTGEDAKRYLEEHGDAEHLIIDIELDDDLEEENNFIIKDKDGKDIEKEVKVEIKDGKKIITETTTKDGKSETKVYKGKEAENYWNTSEGKKIKIKELKGDGTKKIIIKKEIKKTGD